MSWHKIISGILHNKSNKKYQSLTNNGERVDINMNAGLKYEQLDMYQKSHLERYLFALDHIKPNSICGDFACGTGYGCAILSNKCKSVIGIDNNALVIEQISQRYKSCTNAIFIAQDLLTIQFESHFDTIISFETIEHLEEHAIISLLKLFHKALNPEGKLIFSTPYMQEQSELALSMGFHKTFEINEHKISSWLLGANFKNPVFDYQDYTTHKVGIPIFPPNFIISTALK